MTQAPLPLRPIANPLQGAETPLSIVTKPFGGPKRRGRPRRRNTLGEAADTVYYPPHAKLGYREFRDLIRRAQSGDIDARNAVWIANARLAYSIANMVRFDYQLTPDVLQDIQLAIARCIPQYNLDLGFEFSTYAFVSGKREVQRSLLRHSNRLSVGAGPTTSWFMSLNRFHRSGEGPPAVQELMQLQPLAQQGDGIYALHAFRIHSALSLTDIHPDGVPTPAVPSLTEAMEDLAPLHRAIAALHPVQSMVLKLRFGLAGHPPLTLEQVGQVIGVTRERVRQLQNRALSRLRESPLLRGFDPPRPAPPPLPSSPPDLTPDPPAPEAPTTP